jgi:hypothetical protein
MLSSVLSILTLVCGAPKTQLAKLAGYFSDKSLQRLSNDIKDEQQFNWALLLSCFLIQNQSGDRCLIWIFLNGRSHF